MSRISSAPASLPCTKQACVLRFWSSALWQWVCLSTNKKRKNSPSKAGFPGVLWNPHWVSSFWRTETSWGKLDFVCLVKTPEHPQKPLDVSVTLDWLWCWHFQRNRNIVEQCERSQERQETQINTCYFTNYSPSIFIGTFTFTFWLTLDFDGYWNLVLKPNIAWYK